MYQREITFGEAIKKTLTQNYCNFEGRTSRSEFWWFALFTFLVSFAVGIITMRSEVARSVLSAIVNLGFLLPNLGLAVRRLHDTGRSGWWVLLGLIPVVGWIILIVWYCAPSQQNNQYGPTPNIVY